MADDPSLRLVARQQADPMVRLLCDDRSMTERFLDRLHRHDKLDWCRATHLDGPLAGRSGYAINRLGYRSGFRKGPHVGTYEVVELSSDGQPAKLRLVELSLLQG
ncbi:hypothetical protein [Nocardia sp. NPDC052316]|uniref:hypothetical protein n=1 Tax=Nocardia sp. NPDC052316 TaxID=3364329 RepID=UPI0037CBD647